MLCVQAQRPSFKMPTFFPQIHGHHPPTEAPSLSKGHHGSHRQYLEHGSGTGFPSVLFLHHSSSTAQNHLLCRLASHGRWPLYVRKYNFRKIICFSPCNFQRFKGFRLSYGGGFNSATTIGIPDIFLNQTGRKNVIVLHMMTYNAISFWHLSFSCEKMLKYNLNQRFDWTICNIN